MDNGDTVGASVLLWCLTHLARAPLLPYATLAFPAAVGFGGGLSWAQWSAGSRPMPQPEFT